MKPAAMTTVLFAALLLVPLACGNTDSDAGRSDGSAGSGGSGGSGGSAGSGTGGSAGSGGLQFDAGGGTGGINDAATDPITVADAGWFDCGGCACDGTTHYCEQVSAGVSAPAPPDPPDGATVCGSEAGTDCLPLPSECAGVPSCGCVPKPYGDICSCQDAGGGILVHCALP